MTITICGGGNLGHVLLGVLSANKKHTINLLTNRPEDWNHQICVEDCNNRRYVGNLPRRRTGRRYLCFRSRHDAR